MADGFALPLRAADGALLFHPAAGRAAECWGYGHHQPTPARFVWHHLLPEALGGPSDKPNLIPVCDTCHYCIHELLYMLRLSGGDPACWRITAGRSARHGTGLQRNYAWRGWQLCLAAGMQDRIPNEGGTWAARP
jgi:hypothetical protein